MKNDIISSKQGICLITLFISGSTLLMGGALESKHDAWIARIVGILFAIPIIIIYSRILTLFPGKNLFQIVEEVFGVIIGKIITLIFTWYAFHLGALLLRNLSEFIQITSMPETPLIIHALMMGLLCIWATKKGMGVVGRWAEFILPLAFSMIVIFIILSGSKMKLDNILPIMHKNTGPITKDAFSIFSFPFAETVIFLMIGDAFQNKTNYYKVYLISLLLGGVAILCTALRNILVMGEDFVCSIHFPSYYAIGLINIGDFLQRFEIVVSVVLLWGIFIKASMCLIAACKGFSYSMKIVKYKTIAVPMGLLMINFSSILYGSVMEMTEWATKIYPIYAFPFQVILPLIIWIVAEIKVKKVKD